MSIKPIRYSHNNGFTLMEVLVAAVVLGIGILGLVTLMVTSMKSNQSSFYRSTASSLIYDMADRIRQNSAQAKAGAYDGVDTSTSVPADPLCITAATGCSPTQIAKTDIHEWAANFTNVDNVTDYTSMLPNGVGTITRDTTNNIITIKVSWSDTDLDSSNPAKRIATTNSLSLKMSP